jgi:hypothetical protein
MKVILFILIALLQVTNQQLDKKLTLRRNGVSIIQVIREIKKQTGYSAAWNEKEINVDRKINVNFKNATIKTVLDEISKKLNISYVINNQAFVLINAKTPVRASKKQEQL